MAAEENERDNKAHIVYIYFFWGDAVAPLVVSKNNPSHSPKRIKCRTISDQHRASGRGAPSRTASVALLARCFHNKQRATCHYWAPRRVYIKATAPGEVRERGAHAQGVQTSTRTCLLITTPPPCEVVYWICWGVCPCRFSRSISRLFSDEKFLKINIEKHFFPHFYRDKMLIIGALKLTAPTQRRK